MSLSDAIKEAYADPEVTDDIIETLELDHPTFDTPVRIVANTATDQVLQLESGATATFVACPVAIQLDGFDDDGPTSAQVRIDNVSGLLHPYLKDAIQAGHPLTVVYRAWTTAEMSRPGEVRGGLVLSRVSLSPTTAMGTLEPASKADRQAFPRMTYSLADYQALHGLG